MFITFPEPAFLTLFKTTTTKNQHSRITPKPNVQGILPLRKCKELGKGPIIKPYFKDILCLITGQQEAGVQITYLGQSFVLSAMPVPLADLHDS